MPTVKGKHSAQTSSLGFSLAKALGTRRQTESKEHIFTNTTHCLVSTGIGVGRDGAHFLTRNLTFMSPCSSEPSTPAKI